MSSPADRHTTASPVAFALQELIACWDQAYAALVQGDLDQVAALLDVADERLAAAGSGRTDSPDEAHLRATALGSRGRLEHGMSSGLAGLAEELARVRHGQKTLRGYGRTDVGVGDHVARTV